jgi:hypothetical protein
MFLNSNFIEYNICLKKWVFLFTIFFLNLDNFGNIPNG